MRGLGVAAEVGEHVAADVAEHAAEDAAEHAGEDAATEAADHAGDVCNLSFAPQTLVATPTGAVPIAALKVGDQVEAYDPATGKASAQTVQRTSIHHDTGLLDVTLRVTTRANTTTTAKAAPSENTTAATTKATADPGTVGVTATSASNETVHTTANHPWLSADHGWVLAGQLKLGEPVRLLDGRTAIVVATVVVPGAADMWDLTVSNVHDFAVGSGMFVVHNCSRPVDPADQAKLDRFSQKYDTKQLPDGRTRFHDKFKPATNPGSTSGSRFVREFNPDTGMWRSWYESYAADGSVRVVHPKTIDSIAVDLPHYRFDHGRFLGTFQERTSDTCPSDYA